MNEIIEQDVIESPTSMTKLDVAVRALAEASSLEDVKHISDVAEAARTYAKAARLGLKAQNKAAEIHLRAQRKAGEILAQMEKAQPGPRPRVRLHDATDLRPKLADLGIDKSQSHRSQRIASVPENEFEAHLQEIRQTEREITTASVLALRRSATTDARNQTSQRGTYDSQWRALIDSGTRFGTVYADPLSEDGLTVDQLCALPVETIVADHAHLHLWTTDAHLFDAKRVVEAWGFDYAGCFVWVKPEANVGNYWRVAHEYLLLGVRGSCAFMDKSLKSWAEMGRTEHSVKPEAVRDMIERASPAPRLELFARSPVEGWTVWGNQIEQGIVDGEVNRTQAEETPR